MYYLCKRQDGADFTRFLVDPVGVGKIHFAFREAVAKRNSTDNGWLIFGHCLIVSAEYGAKDGGTIEKTPHIFIEFHDKEWEKEDYRTKVKTTVEPTPIELYLSKLFESNPDLQNGFTGRFSLGDESTTFAILEKLPEESHASVLEQIVDIKPVELSEEFNKLKIPAVGAGFKKGGYASGQKEIDKLNDRAAFVAKFLNPDNENGIVHEDHQIAMLRLFKPADDGTFKDCHYRNYVALILGASSVL